MSSGKLMKIFNIHSTNSKHNLHVHVRLFRRITLDVRFNYGLQSLNIDEILNITVGSNLRSRGLFSCPTG